MSEVNISCFYGGYRQPSSQVEGIAVPCTEFKLLRFGHNERVGLITKFTSSDNPSWFFTQEAFRDTILYTGLGLLGGSLAIGGGVPGV